MHRLLTEAPVYPDRQFDQVYVARYDDGRAVLSDRSLARDPRNARRGSLMRQMLGADSPDYQPTMLVMDDPDHKRLRGLVSKAFNQRSVDAWRPRIRAVAEQLLDAMAGKPCFDIIQAYARPLPVTVIAEMLGVDPAHRDDFIRWSEALIYVFTPIRTPEQEEALAWAGMALDDFFKAAIDARRAATI